MRIRVPVKKVITVRGTAFEKATGKAAPAMSRRQQGHRRHQQGPRHADLPDIGLVSDLFKVVPELTEKL